MIDVKSRGSGYYRVYVDDVEISQHITEREAEGKAIEEAINLAFDSPSAKVHYAHDYEVDVTINAKDITVKAISGGTLTQPDSEPDPIAGLFVDEGSVPASTTRLSNQIQILGVDSFASVTIEVSGDGGYRLNGGLLTTAPGVGALGDLIALEHQANATPEQQSNTTLTLDGTIIDTFTSTTVSASAEDIFLFDDFHQYSPDPDVLPIANPTRLPSEAANLWYSEDTDKSGNTRPATASVNSDLNHVWRGSRSLLMRGDGGGTKSPQSPQITTNNKDPDDGPSNVYYMKDIPGIHGLDSGSVWQLDYYNRMHCRIKVPSNMSPLTDPKNPNDGLHWALFYRASATTITDDEEEPGGWHTYHKYAGVAHPLGTTDENSNWWHVIMDGHPHTRRGVSGSIEVGDHYHYPTLPNGTNYFDCMTRFYFSFKRDAGSYPANWYVDAIELYREENAEDEDNLYGFAAGMHSQTKNIILRWLRHKDQNAIDNEVRYSFSNIHDIGWSNATFAASVTPTGSQGYNGMEWQELRQNLTGYTNQSTLYVGVKSDTEPTLFKQITVEIGD